jgi:hypothetical protein
VTFSVIGRPSLLSAPDDDRGGVLVTRMAPNLQVVYNPNHLPLTVNTEPPFPIDRTGVTFVDVGNEWNSLNGLPVTVDGAPPPPWFQLNSPEEAISVVDRTLPHRGHSPDGTELANCLARLPAATYSRPTLWIPVARHNAGLGGFPGILARIGDVAAGFCVRDPDDGLTFVGAPLPAERDRPLTVAVHRGSALTAVLLTAPPGTTGMTISAVQESNGTTTLWDSPCTLADGLALCTAEDFPDAAPGDPVVTVEAISADHPEGVEVFRR